MDKESMKEHKERSLSPTDSSRAEEQRLLRTIHAAIHDGQHRALLGIPSSGLQTYEGLLIKTNHRLKIKVFTEGCCTDNPTMKLPICLGTPASPSPQPPPELEQPASAAPSLPTATAVPVPAPSAPPLPSPAPPMAVPSAPPPEWADALTATPVAVGQSAAVVGGNAIWEAEEDGEGDLPPMAVAEVVPSLPDLLREVEYAVSPLATVRKRMGEDQWRRQVFDVMTPSQYASVIKAVAIEFDQPDMAALVAPVVNSSNFTHAYVVAALRVVADWIRTPLLGKVLPLCRDLDENADRIKAELSDWELVCTQRDFEQGGNVDWRPDSPLLQG